jgi:dolichol-phosphate mannosyltransferase
MRISVVVPVFNEEDNLRLLHERLTAVCSSIQNIAYEIIFVNDGSQDGSLSVIKEIVKTDKCCAYISLSRNFGQQAAISAGIDQADGDAIVLIDADLQDPPELIALMYEKFIEGNDVIYAQRQTRSGESTFKRLTATIFYRLLRLLTKTNIPLDTGDFRMISKKTANYLRQMPEKNKFLRGQIAWLGLRQTAVLYHRESRTAGKSGYTFKKMLNLALDAFFSFSDIPIRFVTLTGFAVSFIAFVMIVYTYYKKIFTQDYVVGWASLMVSILFLGGVQLISVGILGEYISRIYRDVKNRPLYVVQEKSNTGE